MYLMYTFHDLYAHRVFGLNGTLLCRPYITTCQLGSPARMLAGGQGSIPRGTGRRRTSPEGSDRRSQHVGRSDTGVLVLTEREKSSSISEGQTIQIKQKA